MRSSCLMGTCTRPSSFFIFLSSSPIALATKTWASNVGSRLRGIEGSLVGAGLVGLRLRWFAVLGGAPSQAHRSSLPESRTDETDVSETDETNVELFRASCRDLPRNQTGPTVKVDISSLASLAEDVEDLRTLSNSNPCLIGSKIEALRSHAVTLEESAWNMRGL